jgi:hypothetical protein
VHNEQIKIDSNADQFGQTIEQLKTLVETFGPMMKGRSLNQGKVSGKGDATAEGRVQPAYAWPRFSVYAPCMAMH